MCHHELRPTSVSHPFSFLNSSLGLAEGNINREYTGTILIFGVFIQILLFQVAFLIVCAILVISPDFPVVLLLQHVALFQSKKLV